MGNWNDKVNFIWSIAELLRGPYRPNQYKDVMLPMTALRRLDCALEPTKEDVLKKFKELEGSKVKNIEPILNRIAGYNFHNTSRYTFQRLKDEPENIAPNLVNYIKGFSGKARDILDSFGFEEQIQKLEKHDRLFLLISKFAEIDLHPDSIDNHEMGYVFEELVRKFNEASNEEAGDHFTPREVIRLMVNLVFDPDKDILSTVGIIKSLFDPTVGTGGMLSVSDNYVKELNPNAELALFGQDYNEQSYAICGSDMMIKGEDLENIKFGDSLTNDQFKGKKFDYMLANPPFGVEWKPQQDFVKKEADEQGFGGRFGAGLPRISDGSLLFLQHMISKMKPVTDGGTRLAIVFNGSPLFTGGAGSGESEIRRWIIENDWLEGIVAMPDQLFYNTGIFTYLWIITNRKGRHRKGKIQLINATSFYKKMKKSLGNKRNEIDDDHRAEIVKIYEAFEENEFSKIYDNEDFGYNRLAVERPLRLNFKVDAERIERVKAGTKFSSLAESKKKKDKQAALLEIEEGKRFQEQIISALKTLEKEELVKNREAFSDTLKEAFKKSDVKVPTPMFNEILASLSERDDTADICTDSKGNPEPDSDLRDYENVPLKENIEDYFKREVIPHVPDAWIEESKTKVGYELNFNQYFYKYVPPRPLQEIEHDLKTIEKKIADMLSEVA
ncbi:MAG: SAM-dependent DNA methyltransferase [Tissierellales bacterium]|nr:SAM-dependent DNA methyltransferase [Tissierellales bacterium]